MTHATEGRQDVIDFVNNIQAKVNAQEGNSLPNLQILLFSREQLKQYFVISTI